MGFFNFLANKEQPLETQSEDIQRSFTNLYVLPNAVSDWGSINESFGNSLDSLSIVYACVNRRANTVAQLPLRVLRTTVNGHEEATDHPFFQLLARRPNSFQTPFTLMSWLVRQLDLYGNAYIQRIRNGKGETIELIPKNCNIASIAIDKETGVARYQIDGVMFEQEQIIHFKSYSGNGVNGLSTLKNFERLFENYIALENAGTQIAKNTAMASNIVSHPANIKEEELKKLKANWDNGFRNGASGKTAWMPSTFEVKEVPNSLTAADAQYIEQKKFLACRIAADIFGIPLHMLGLSSAPTYASVEQQTLEWMQYTITPILANIEQTFNHALFPDEPMMYVKFLTRDIIRGDTTARTEQYKFMLDHGLISPNQYHIMEDTGIHIDAEDGGDDFIRPVNFAAIGQAEALETGSVDTDANNKELSSNPSGPMVPISDDITKQPGQFVTTGSMGRVP